MASPDRPGRGIRRQQGPEVRRFARVTFQRESSCKLARRENERSRGTSSTTLFSHLTTKTRNQASPFSLFFASELTPLTPSAPVGFGDMALDNGSGGGAAGGGAGAGPTATTTTTTTAAAAAAAATAGNVAGGVAPSPTGGAFDLDCLDVHGRCVGVLLWFQGDGPRERGLGENCRPIVCFLIISMDIEKSSCLCLASSRYPSFAFPFIAPIPISWIRSLHPVSVEEVESRKSRAIVRRTRAGKKLIESCRHFFFPCP